MSTSYVIFSSGSERYDRGMYNLGVKLSVEKIIESFGGYFSDYDYEIHWSKDNTDYIKDRLEEIRPANYNWDYYKNKMNNNSILESIENVEETIFLLGQILYTDLLFQDRLSLIIREYGQPF